MPVTTGENHNEISEEDHSRHKGEPFDHRQELALQPVVPYQGIIAAESRKVM